MVNESKTTSRQIAECELAEVLDMALSDMGKDGKCICGYVKARMRVAIEPFLLILERISLEYQLEFTLDEAKKIIKECDQ
jgi:hypothetical protein